MTLRRLCIRFYMLLAKWELRQAEGTLRVAQKEAGEARLRVKRYEETALSAQFFKLRSDPDD